MTIYLFVTKEIYNPVAVETAIWSCSKTAQEGDRAFVYLTKNGIVCEWEITSDAQKDPIWKSVCGVKKIRIFADPSTIQDMRNEIAKNIWPVLYTNFRGHDSIRVPDKVLTLINGIVNSP